jgi:hypothetical protein
MGGELTSTDETWVSHGSAAEANGDPRQPQRPSASMLGAMPVRALSRAVGRLLIKVGVWLGCCQGERALESLRKPLPARGSGPTVGCLSLESFPSNSQQDHRIQTAFPVGSFSSSFSFSRSFCLPAMILAL